MSDASRQSYSLSATNSVGSYRNMAPEAHRFSQSFTSSQIANPGVSTSNPQIRTGQSPSVTQIANAGVSQLYSSSSTTSRESLGGSAITNPQVSQRNTTASTMTAGQSLDGSTITNPQLTSDYLPNPYAEFGSGQVRAGHNRRGWAN